MCTSIRFTDDKGNMFFGRNLDWEVDFGEKVYVTQRGFTHDRFLGGKVATKYAVIGMTIVVDGMPLYFDAANEKGLAVAGLNFPGYAKYETAPVDGKVNVAAFAFPLYIASQFESVDEVEAALKEVAIVGEPFNSTYDVALLHWLIGDAKRSIVVEYQEDGMHIYHNDLDVLANQPAFPYHRENVRSYISCTPEFPESVTWDKATLAPYGSGSGMRGIPGDFYSPSRFVRAAYLNAHYPQQSTEETNISRLFHTLAGVAMIEGGAKMADGNYEITLYTGAYSANTRTYYSSTYHDPQIRSFALDSVALDGAAVIEAPEAKRA